MIEIEVRSKLKEIMDNVNEALAPIDEIIVSQSEKRDRQSPLSSEWLRANSLVNVLEHFKDRIQKADQVLIKYIG